MFENKVLLFVERNGAFEKKGRKGGFSRKEFDLETID